MNEGEEIEGFFHDDGTPMNPGLIPKPGLCVNCRHNNDQAQEITCALTRMDQQAEDDFRCDAFDKLSQE